MTSKPREKRQFHMFLFPKLFHKQLLVKLQQTNFCLKLDKMFLRQNIECIGDSHACTKKQQIVTSVLVSTP